MSSNSVTDNKKLINSTVIFMTVLLITTWLATFIAVVVEEKWNINGLKYMNDIFIYGCTAPVIYIYINKNKTYTVNKYCYKKLNLTGLLSLIVMCFFIYRVICFCNILVLSLIPDGKVNQADSGVYTIQEYKLIYGLFFYAIMAPIYEELVFRKIILSRLRQYGKRFGIVVTAFLFALYHCNVRQFVFAFLFGIVLGYVMTRYNKIIYPIIIHGFCNAVNSLSYLNLCYRQDNTNKVFRAVYSLFIIIVIIVGLVKLIRRRKEINIIIHTHTVEELRVSTFLKNKYMIILAVVVLGITYINFGT